MKLYSLKNNCGFTLLELLIGFAVLVIIVLVSGVFLTNIFGSESFFKNSLITQADVQQSMQIFGLEIRSMGPSDLGSYPIDIAATSTLGFYSDIDEDGIMEHVRYFLNGQILQKGVIQPTGSPLVYNPASEVITDVIQNVIPTSTPLFSYYDNTYDGTKPPLSQPVNVQAVTVIGINFTTQEQNPSISVKFATVETPRNLRTNL